MEVEGIDSSFSHCGERVTVEYSGTEGETYYCKVCGECLGTNGRTPLKRSGSSLSSFDNSELLDELKRRLTRS